VFTVASPFRLRGVTVCRDRNRARHAVGEGFPFPLFRWRNGVTISPWRTSLEAPLKSRTVGFAESGSKHWLVLRRSSRGLERFKRWFVYTLPLPVCLRPRLLEPSSAFTPVLSSRPLRRPRRPPSVQSPFAQLGCYLRWGDLISLLGEHYPSVIARTGSCAAPVGLSPPSVFGLVWRVLAGCYQSLLPTAASRRYSENLSLDAGPHTPAVHRVLAPVSSTVSSAFPKSRTGRLPASVRELRLLAV
jgi:hypothetical protein